MIRIILAIQLFLCSCSTIDLGYIEVFQESFRKNEINDLESFYDSNFSFIRLSQGRNQAVYVLSNYEDGVETWTGATGEEVITYLGLILSSKNFLCACSHYNFTAAFTLTRSRLISQSNCSDRQRVPTMSW